MNQPTYQDFIQEKSQMERNSGFEPNWLPDFLFPFQKALCEWAIRKGRAAIFADCGLGKGQPINANVLTPSGWVEIGKLRVGDKVIASNGKAANVIGVYPKSERETFRFYFSDGSSFVVDDDHLHICRTNNDRRRGKSWRVMSTKELRSANNLRYGAIGKSRNYDIPIVGDVEFDCFKPLVIKPYLLGVLLGDGYCKGNIFVSSADDEVLQRVKRELPDGVTLKQKSKYDWAIMTGNTGNRRHPFRQALHGMGIIGKTAQNKCVPSEYLYATSDDRLELLRGLMDTDGYIDKGGTCQFYSVSQQLADAVVHLVRSLGGIPTRSIKQTSCNGKAGLPCHVVTFSLATHNPFYLARKAMRWNSSPRDNGRWIDRIEFECVQKTVCIAMDSADESYVTEHFIVTHNTPMQLVWAQNVHKHTGKPVLILTPLAVAPQHIREAHKFGIEAIQSRDGKIEAPIVVTNYQRLHYFDRSKFGGVVGDESSILKNFDGVTKEAVTEFMRLIPYRLLCTATAAPNDYVELGTSSEALGYLRRVEMLAQFFSHDGGETSKWRLKKHAAKHLFWQWCCNWARACRKPSDLGCSDEGFKLPELVVSDHIIQARTKNPDFLFDLPAVGLQEQRDERRRTIRERCEMAASLVIGMGSPSVSWCHLNEEGHLLEKLIPGAVEVEGTDADEFKEEAFEAFQAGKIKHLISKPVIAGFGLNWQHCTHQTFFPSHSFEQWYQAIRRSWRFGQTHKVTIDTITSEGEADVLRNMLRKAEQADLMFSGLVRLMNNELRIELRKTATIEERIPAWL